MCVFKNSVLLVCPVLLMASCAVPKLSSRWADGAVSVDGFSKEWKTENAGESGGLAFDVQNDAENLYIFASPKTQTTKKMMAAAGAQHFTIWIDLDARKEKGLGIQIASEGARGREGGRPPMHSGGDSRQAAPSAGGEEPPARGDEAAQPPQRAQSGNSSVKLIGFQGGPAPESGGIEVKLGNVYTRGVLEAKVPINMLGGVLPQTLMIGFTADALKEEGAKDASPQNRRGGDMGASGAMGGPGGGGMGRSGGGGGMGGPGGGMGGPGGGMGGPGGGMGNSSSAGSAVSSVEEPLEIWVLVTAAQSAQKI